MEFDLTISFDRATYLNPQLYMMIDTLKDNIPDDTILHVITNRPDDDKVLQHIKDSINVKIYKKEPFTNLKSRCQYMFHCFEIETEKEWVIKTEIDVLFLKHLKEFHNITKDGYDIVIQSENRRVIQNDNLETRLWRQIYKAMEIKMPEFKIHFVENHEEGRPLLATGVVIVKSKHLDIINKRWIPLTKICEKWIDYGIHPNEFAFTGMIFDEGWNWNGLHSEFNFNPIGFFRKGAFPSTELIDNCIIPDDVVIFDYHRFPWLAHVAKYNPKIQKIIDRNRQYIPDDVWNMSFDKFKENV